MKNLIVLFALILGYFPLQAQSLSTTDQPIKTADNTLMNNAETPVLESFKATRSERKVISKIRSYVTPKVFGKKVNAATLEGKTVTLQLGLNEQGAIDHIIVVKGIQPKIDARVVALVKAYDETKPLAGSKLAKPSVIQLDIPVVPKKYYGRN